jgi:phospholipid-translocating ATPase
MLLRGSTLRNTDCAFGIAIFTGHETKVMKNSAQALPKWSNLEGKGNTAIYIVLMSQLIIAIIAAWFGS